MAFWGNDSADSLAMGNFVVEIIGFISAGLVFCSLYMRTMSRLRRVAILANISSLFYAWLMGAIPMVILQLVLLPLNIVRIRQMNRILDRIGRVAEETYDFSPFIPYMKTASFKAGEVLFRKGDRSNQLYLIKFGEVWLEELEKSLGETEILGEIGIFAANRFRTATAKAVTDVEAYAIDYETVRLLHYQNPDFSMYLINIVVRRLVENERKALAKVG